MARYRRTEIEDLEEPIAEVIKILDELIANHEGDVQRELQGLRSNAYIIQEKIPKICTLRDFKGYKFAIFDEGSSTPRTASYDESMRLIMGYKQGNVIELLKNWVVINGEWVKRPDTNPDGSQVVR